MQSLITVLIVDDEKLIIEDLTTLIDWEEHGYKVVATAFNGKQGLRKYRELKPQLILTDIRMPFMDGIEMISEIRKEDKEIPILLLTAYEDFSYAKAAIRLGITEYIMKNEINAEMLSKLLHNLKESIRIQNTQRTIVTSQMLEDFFQSDVISKENSFKEFIDKKLTALIVEQDCPISISREPLDEVNMLTAGRIMAELKSMNYYGFEIEAVFRLSSRRVVLLMSERGAHYDVKENCREIARQIRENMRSLTSYSFSVYYFETLVSPMEIKSILRENADIFGDKYFRGAGMTQVLLRKPVSRNGSEKLDISGSQLVDVLHICEKTAMTEYFERIRDEVCASGNRAEFVRLTGELYDLLLQSNRKVPFEKQLDLGIEKNGVYWTDARSVFHWFAEQFSAINTYLLTDGKEYSKTVTDTMEYIHSHFSNPELSVNELADHVKRSVGYLSTAFKKETGVNLKNYITSVRIETAKMMIETGNYKIYEIGSKVGYHSSQYFSQAFFKETGMLPTEYKEKRQQ